MSAAWAFAVFSLFFLPGFLLVAAGKRLVARLGAQPRTPGGTADRLRVVGTTLMLIGGVVYVALLVRQPFGVVIGIAATLWAGICTLPAARRIPVATQTTFRCTPAEAFDLLVDPRREPEYRWEVESSEIVAGGHPWVDSVVRQTVRLPPRGNSQGVYIVGEERITEYDRPRAFATHIVGKRMGSRTVFEATAEGTRVTTVSDLMLDFHTALWGGTFFRSQLASQIRQSREEGWERARKLLEHPAA